MVTKYWDRSKEFSVRLAINGTVEMADWCKENGIEDFIGSSGAPIWSFRKKEDAIAFKLRFMD